MGSRRTESESPAVQPGPAIETSTPTPTAQPTTPLSSATASSSTLATDTSKQPSSARRGKITQVACVACRQRKSKCDGNRPVCAACRSRVKSHCEYDVTLEQRKPSSLRQRVTELENEVTNFRDLFPLILSALPPNLKLRFEGFIDATQQGGLSGELVADAKRRLAGSRPRHEQPDGLDDLEEGLAMMSSNAQKYGLESPRADLGSCQIPSSNTDSWLFSPVHNDPGEGFASAKTVQPAIERDVGLEFPVPIDDEGVANTYWRLQGIGPTTWPPTHAQPAHNTQQNSTPSNVSSISPSGPWRQAIVDGKRTLQVFGRLETPVASTAPQGQPISLDVPLYVVQPLHKEDRRPLSGMYSGVFTQYRDVRRQLIASGVDPAAVLGPDDIEFRRAVHPSNFHNNLRLSIWAAEVFGAHRNMRPSDRVACAWLVAMLMKWQIFPTLANYERMPNWLRPSPKQCFVPHFANLDYLPWPEVRDALIESTEEQSELTIASVSVNWPLPDGQIMYLDNNANKLKLSLTFQAHILNLDNWSLGLSVLNVLPQLAGLCRFVDDR